MSYDLIESGKKRILKFDCEGCRERPSISDSRNCLEEVLEGLENSTSIDKVKLKSKYIRAYGKKDLDKLREYIKSLKNARYLVLKNASGEECKKCKKERKSRIENIWSKLRRNPLEGLHDLKIMAGEISDRSKDGPDNCRACRKRFLESGLEKAIDILSETKIIKETEEGDQPYEGVFSPTIRPSFLNSKIKFRPPEEAEIVSTYEIEGSQVKIYYSKKRLEHLYFLIPQEYRLSPTKVKVLQRVKEKLLRDEGNLDSNLAREEIEKKSRNLIMEMALEEETDFEKEEINTLSKSLAKFTVGLGIIETLLSDPKIQDIYVDAPLGNNSLYCYHQEFEQCVTNVLLNPEEAKVLSSKLREKSGRPFSEAEPALDLNFENVRVAAIRKPLSPDGLALAIRRHKSNPWTLPLFVKKNFMTPEAAALLSLLVDSQCSILITGSRGAGKTSLLGALMLELLPKFRILCMEDTAELPVEKLRKLNFKIQRLKTRPSSSGIKNEMSAEDALRAALRLGESVLIMGEVRGPETKSLYEAMRVGAAGNSVLGTIHGSTTKDVYERVVYDLDIPPSSFKATDAIAVASPIRRKGGSERIRRLTQVSEVRKDWKDDPLSENGFADLLDYSPKGDELERTETLELNRSRLLNSIAESWSMETSEIKKNLKVRRQIQETLAEHGSSKETLLKAENVVKSNLAFHRILEGELGETEIDYERIFKRWKGWLGENLL